jgi:S-(hydroxymethyl)glutathione dehydrogenase / alcohol dehydrogenase
MKVRALVRTSFGVLEQLDIEVDDLAPDEVLVRVVAAGVCHSDLTMLNGEMLNVSSAPRVLGHELGGVVERVGERVSEFRPGDHVVGCGSRSCGYCRQCLEGFAYLCANRTRIARERPRLSHRGAPIGQAGQLGAFAEMVLTGADTLVKVGDDIPLDAASLLGCAVITGVGAVMTGARPRAGSQIAVVGCGGVGLNVVQAATLTGARRVIAIDLNVAKLELASEFGATHLINPLREDAVDKVRALTDGGVDYAFECAGVETAALQALEMVAPGHELCLVGVPRGGTTYDFPASEIVLNAKQVKGIHMGNSNFKRDIPILADLYRHGRLKLDELVGERIALAGVSDAMSRMDTSTVARSVVVFT